MICIYIYREVSASRINYRKPSTNTDSILTRENLINKSECVSVCLFVCLFVCLYVRD
jgi:hypothetical protein